MNTSLPGSRLVAGMDPRLPPAEVGPYVRRVEALGYDALHVPEMLADPFALAALALDATSTLRVRTGVALAFVRSPMASALAAWTLTNGYDGRFALGLGPQIRPNVEERYGMAFDHPVDRMADHVAAVRACFAAFAGDAPLDHRGRFVQLTRLQPDFVPDGDLVPEVWLGAGGDRMVELAGRVGDGLITHPTASHPADLTDRIVPALQRGAAEAGRAVPAVVVSPLVATGPDDAAVAEARESVRRRLAFLYSTPAYRPVLERLGHAEVGPALRALVRDSAWDRLAAVLPDALVDEVAVCAPWDDLADRLIERYAGIAAGVMVRPPADPTLDVGFAERFVARIAG